MTDRVAVQQERLVALLDEKRSFPPSEEFRRQANASDPAIYERAQRDLEKFWGEDGAEAILQWRGEHLSDDQPLEAFWERRQAQTTGQRPYRRVG